MEKKLLHELSILRNLAAEVLDEHYAHVQYCIDNKCEHYIKTQKMRSLKEWLSLHGETEELENGWKYQGIVFSFLKDAEKCKNSTEDDPSLSSSFLSPRNPQDLQNEPITIYDSENPTSLGYVTAELIKASKGLRTLGTLAKDMDKTKEEFIAELKSRPKFTKLFQTQKDSRTDIHEDINDWVTKENIIIKKIELSVSDTQVCALVLY